MTEPIWRSTARVLPINDAGQILLLHGWTPQAPDSPYWFTVGGAVEDGETLVEAASRELLEETGIRLLPEAMGEPLGIGHLEFDWDRRHVSQDETYFCCRVGDAVVSLAGLDDFERRTTDDARWWAPDELAASGESVNDDILGFMHAAVQMPPNRDVWVGRTDLGTC